MCPHRCALAWSFNKKRPGSFKKNTELMTKSNCSWAVRARPPTLSRSCWSATRSRRPVIASSDVALVLGFLRNTWIFEKRVDFYEKYLDL